MLAQSTPLLEAALRLLPQLFLKATLLLLAAGALVLTLRRGSAAARHQVWAAALAGVLALPVCLLLPLRFEVLPGFLQGPANTARWTREASPAATPASTPAPAAGARTQTSPAVRGEAPASGTTTPATLAPTPNPAGSSGSWRLSALGQVGWARLLLGVWLLGASLLTLRLLVGTGTVWWLARSGERVTDEGWTTLADRLSRAFDAPSVRLIRSRWTAMPMTWGVVRPVVLLPMDADEWPLERREVVLTHELAHVARRDVFTLALAQLACALHWFNPMSWIALRELRAEAERCADDWVLRAGTRASTYAGHLLEMVRLIGRARVPAALALPMAQRSTFEGRLLAILEPGVDRGLVRRGQALLTGAGLAGLVLLLGAMRPAAAHTPADSAADWREGREVLASSGAPAALEVSTEAGRVRATVTHGSPLNLSKETLERLPEQAAAAVQALSAPAGSAAASQDGRGRAVAALARALSDPSGEVRRSAIQALGSLEDPRSVAALIAALRGDQDPQVRATAAWALGQIEDRSAVPALVEAMTSDRAVEVRRTATWALGQIEDGAAVDGLMRAMRDADAEVRSTALWALGQIEDRRAVPALSAALREGDADVRRQAAWALGQIEDRAAVPGLVTALRDSDRTVRETAVWALGQIESPDAVPALSGLLRDPEAGVRKQAVWALGQIEAPSAVGALGQVLQGDAQPEVRETAAWALGQIESDAAIPALSAALQDRSPRVRQQAAWALGQVEPDHAPEALIAALRDEDRGVRRTAVWALGQIEDPSAAPGLRAALRDADPDVKRGALQALARRGDPAAADALTEMLRDPDPQVRAAAAAALAGHQSWVDPRPEPRPQPRPQPRPRPMN
jgi:HEAT repeat protein/beta-lactamase regulating signal transducer with metallopeptidase domain